MSALDRLVAALALRGVMAAVVLSSAFVAGRDTAHAGDGASSLVIVFDGSGSMWGRLGPGPQSKFVAAREGLAQALAPSLATSTDRPVGLVSFGRRRGDCSDVELISPVEAGDRQRITAPLERLNPRGRGPITLALRTAAKALESQPGQRHVLIIHDEPDNCSLDACAAASELKAADPLLVVSTVTLGATPDDVRAMACVAQVTGGRSFVADTPQEATLSIGSAIRLASLGHPASPQAAVPGSRGSDKVGPPRARFSAKLGASGQILTRAITWRIWTAGSDGATVAESSQPAPEIALEPGKYRVEARSGLVSAIREFEIKAGGTLPVDLVLEGGQLRTTASLRRGGPPSPTTRITIRPDAGESDAAMQPALWIGPPGELAVPPGSYRIVASEGRARAQRRVTIQSGESVSLDLPLDAGRIALSAMARDGAPALDDVLYRVLEADPEAGDGFREVARSAATVAELVLPAGTYQFVARYGAAETRERITITAGEEVRHTLRIAVGRLLLSARLQGASQDLSDGVMYRLSPAEAGLDAVETSAASQSIAVAPGRYRLEARIGPANAMVARDVEVRSGTEQQVQLAVPAAEVEFRLADALSGLAVAEAFWEITNEQNQVIWRTMQTRPKAVLAAGRYTARLATKSRRFEKAFEVRPGAGVLITLGDD